MYSQKSTLISASYLRNVLTQPAFTCSKLTIKTVDKVGNMLKVYNKGTRMTPLHRSGCLYCKL